MDRFQYMLILLFKAIPNVIISYKTIFVDIGSDDGNIFYNMNSDWLAAMLIAH